MIYVMLILLIFSLYLLIRNLTSKSTLFFVLLSTSICVSLFALVVYTAKMGHYLYPDNVLFHFDYWIYLYLSKLNIYYYDIPRMMNIGLACYLYLVPLFAYQYTRRSYEVRTRKRNVLKAGALLLLPLFYVWRYDPETYLDFYLLIHSPSSSERTIYMATQFLAITDNVHYIWIPLYLCISIYLFIKAYRTTRIKLKKTQIFSLTVCLVCLNILCLMIIFLSPFKPMYSSGSQLNFLLVPGSIQSPFYYYYMIPISLLIVMMVMSLFMVRNRGLDSISLLTEWHIRRNMKVFNEYYRGIFHSFKNTLFTIKVLAEQAEWELDKSNGLETVQRIRQIADLNMETMSKTLDSLRNIRLKTQPTQLIDVIERVLDECKSIRNIRVEKKYDYPEANVYLDPYHMAEVFSILLQNAVEAIHAADRDNEGIINIEVSDEEEWVIIKITDNGVGIDRKLRRKLFKAFFTTKSGGKNWGIGLAYAYKIVQAHMGHLSFDSVKGESTTFQILLTKAKKEDIKKSKVKR